MNTLVLPFPRRPWALRHEICLFALVVGLLAPISFARAQASRLTPAQGSAWATDQQADLAQFSVWAVKFVKSQSAESATAAPDAETLAEGVRLAERRHVVMAAWMYTDPARALAASLPADLREKLPASVLSQLETPFSAVGDYSVDDRSGRREFTIDGRTYGAHVSARPSTTSRRGASLRGFVLDGEVVLDADSLRTSTVDEATSDAGTNPAADASQPRRAPIPHLVNGNDLFRNALLLPNSSGSVADSNVGASKEFGEPNHAGNSGGASVWYQWTAPTTGLATFTTDDGRDHNTVDTLLAVYVGTDVAHLSVVASNDDSLGFNSQVSFPAQAGVTYSIAVDGYLYSFGPSEGNFTLTYFQAGNPNSPQITSISSADVELNAPFSYTITATNSPVGYSASGLPTGLTLDPLTGVITGTVATIGRYVVIVSATNSQGTGAASLTLTVTDQPIHFSFFNSEVALPQSPGVYYLHLRSGNIFGYYAYLEDANYIYHYDLGYEYTFDAGDGKRGIYLYDFASDSFFYTSPVFPFPYLYDFKLNTVLYYFPNPTDNARFNTNGIRYFYNFATSTIITK